MFRDIKPHNILLASPDAEISTESMMAGGEEPEVSSLKEIGKYVLKISDMGLGKHLDLDASSSYNGMSYGGMGAADGSGQAGSSSSGDKGRASGAVGTVGWQAPEILITKGSIASLSVVYTPEYGDSMPMMSAKSSQQTVDVFSLGCVFHYVLAGGEHPFGKWYEREANIINAKVDLSPLRGVPDALDLVSRMVEHNPERRPSAGQVSQHPFFWTSQRRLEFLVDFSDRLEHEQPDSPLVLAVEGNAAAVVGRSWDRKLHRELLDDIGKYRKYDSASVRDCLRLIRNKRHHFNELAGPVKAIMSPLPMGFMLYFENRFPKLLMHCFGVCCRFLSRDKDFSAFCRLIAPLFKTPVVEPTESAVPLSPVFGSAKSLLSENDSEKAGGGAGVAGDEDTGLDRSVVHNGSVSAKSDKSEKDLEPASGSNNDDATTVDTAASECTGEGNTSSCLGAGTGGGCGGGVGAVPQDIGEVMQLLESGVTVWSGGALALTVGCVGWWREADPWGWGQAASSGGGVGQGLQAKSRARPTHLTRASTDAKYRSRLCTHWELTGGLVCPMKKKGKCDFAHGPLELRVKETRRDRWGGRVAPGTVTPDSLSLSGGEDVLGAARSIEKVRAAEGSVSDFELSTKKGSGPADRRTPGSSSKKSSAKK